MNFFGRGDSDAGKQEVPQQQKQVVQVREFQGMIKTDDFAVKEVPVQSELQADEVLVKHLYLSVDPYLRLGEGGLKINQPVANFGVGLVIRSSNKKFPVGTYISTTLKWQEYSVFKPDDQAIKVEAVDNDISASFYTGILGMAGSTAYHGLLCVGDPKPGQTVLVSAASGAVGSVVGQIAKLKGCTVVGTAGSDDKVKYLKEELGFDSAFNYKTTGSLDDTLDQYFPKGIDIYFDNVGGPFLDTTLKHMNKFGRVVVCGMISQYNADELYGLKNVFEVVFKSIRIEGFVYIDYVNKRKGFVKDVTKWLKQGKLKYKEHVTVGLDNAPQAFVELFTGDNFGKAVIKVVPDSAKAQ